MNKSLYSLSYTCVTTGTAGLLFAGIYLLVGDNNFYFLKYSHYKFFHSFDGVLQ